MAVFGGSLHTSIVGPTGCSGGGGLEAGEPVKLESRFEIMRSLKKPFEVYFTAEGGIYIYCKKNDLLKILILLKLDICRP